MPKSRSRKKTYKRLQRIPEEVKLRARTKDGEEVIIKAKTNSYRFIKHLPTKP